MTDKLLFMRQPQPARGSATGNDKSAGVDDFMADVQLEGALAQICAGDVSVLVFGAKALRLACACFRSARAPGYLPGNPGNSPPAW